MGLCLSVHKSSGVTVRKIFLSLQMVSSQRRDEEKVLREQLLQAESDKARLAAELSASQRRLEQSEGSKAVLEQKVSIRIKIDIATAQSIQNYFLVFTQVIVENSACESLLLLL